MAVFACSKGSLIGRSASTIWEYAHFDIGLVRLDDCLGPPSDRLSLVEPPETLPRFVSMIGQQPNAGMRAVHYANETRATLFLGIGTIEAIEIPTTGDLGICHRASVYHGASGSALMTEDRSGVFCVQSESSGSSPICNIYDDGPIRTGNECAPITATVADMLEAKMAAADAAKVIPGLRCTELTGN